MHPGTLLTASNTSAVFEIHCPFTCLKNKVSEGWAVSKVALPAHDTIRCTTYPKLPSGYLKTARVFCIALPVTGSVALYEYAWCRFSYDNWETTAGGIGKVGGSTATVLAPPPPHAVSNPTRSVERIDLCNCIIVLELKRHVVLKALSRHLLEDTFCGPVLFKQTQGLTICN